MLEYNPVPTGLQVDTLTAGFTDVGIQPGAYWPSSGHSNSWVY